MKFDIKALALASAILWGGGTALVAVVNLICGGYGQSYLQVLSSWYPGYHATRSIVQVLIVSVYACADGFGFGAIFAWLYNRLAKAAA